MARNGSGTYILPAGNPVIPNTTITSTQFNATMNDVATALTGSLPRDGQGSMTGPFRLADGSAAVPAFGFNSEASTGLFRAGTGILSVTVSAGERARFLASGAFLLGSTSDSGEKLQVTGTAKITGATALGATTITGAATVSTTLGVTGNATFQSGVSGLVIRTYTAGSAGAIYNASLTASNTNYALFANATNTILNSTTNTKLAVGDAVIVSATAAGVGVAGTLSVSGVSTLAAVSGTTGTFSSTLASTGNFAVNTNKFNVTASNGNTTVAGTLAVSGTSNLSNINGAAVTVSSTLGVTGTTTLAAVNATAGSFSTTLNVVGATTLGDYLEAPVGINGGYSSTNSSGANWGANMWALGPGSYDGSGLNSTYSPGAYGLSWIRSGHASYNSNIGEGIHLFVNSINQSGIGSLGVYSTGRFSTTNMGSAAAPAISIRDNANGFYSSAANTINVTTAGTLSATFSSAGAFTTVSTITSGANIVSGGGITQQASYFNLYPFSGSYDDGGYSRWYWDGNNGRLNFARNGGTGTAGCTISASGFVGDGSLLTNLDATVLTGTVPNANISGAYSGITTFTATELRAGAGTAASPSICFSSDTDTGIYRVGTNSLGVATGGSLSATFPAAGGLVIANPSSGYGLNVAGGGLNVVGDISVAGHITRFESSEITITAGTYKLYSATHGGSRVPDVYQVLVRCKTAEQGYSVGDEIKMGEFINSADYAYQTYANTTTIGFIHVCASSTPPAIRNRTTGALVALTAGSWKVVFKAHWL